MPAMWSPMFQPPKPPPMATPITRPPTRSAPAANTIRAAMATVPLWLDSRFPDMAIVPSFTIIIAVRGRNGLREDLSELEPGAILADQTHSFASEHGAAEADAGATAHAL